MSIDARAGPKMPGGPTRADPVAAAAAVRTASARVLVAPANPAASPFDLLTDRQRQVLALLADGLSTKQVAARLAISVKTVETHRVAVMGRLGLYTVAELTKYAVRKGLTPLAGADAPASGVVGR